MGTYRNSEPGRHCLIIFTDAAINLVERQKLTRILWADIVGYESPKTDAKIDGVIVQTQKGTHFVPIAGSFGPEDKFKDAINLAMVLRSLLGH